MADYAIVFARTARKELEALPAAVVQRIVLKIAGLAHNPGPRGSKKIQGEKNLWRIRHADYRVIYRVIDRQKSVDIISIRHRRDAYK